MDNKKRRLTENLEGYLTEEAKGVIEELSTFGLDRDLAIVLLEKAWDDKRIYELPEEM